MTALRHTRRYHHHTEVPPQKLYWSIGEIADELCVTTSAIRFWLREFDMKIKKSHLTGNRQFTSADRRKLHRIHHLLHVEQFTIKGAKRQLEIRNL